MPIIEENPSSTCTESITMTIGEAGRNPTPDHILDWIEDSFPFLPFLEGDGYQWWEQPQEQIDSPLASLNSTVTATSSTPTNPTVLNHPSPPDSSKKRKSDEDPLPKPSQKVHNPRKNQGRRISQVNDGDAAVEEVAAAKKSAGNKKSASKAAGNNCANGNNKEGRWAEQLLNPCASAITDGHLSRVQHFLYVLNELNSPSGDANHRLAFHGLRALTLHLSTTTSSSSAGHTFASTDSRFFQRSLLKFYEVSPWFAFPNNIANASILQILAEEPGWSRNLHILDIGVSHGVQWPTLLEALTRRPGGPPPLVRITVIAATVESDPNKETPFTIGPPGDNFSSRLLGFAKSMNVNLQINLLDNHPLQNLNAQVIKAAPDETLIVCAQFRVHHLNHNSPDERTEFLRSLRRMEPKGVILSENNMECSCNSCGDFATGFSRRVEYLWRFLDSTSSAFKGRECEERRLMEVEAAKALTNTGDMNEGKEKWCERMRGVGFAGEVFGEDAIDGARALLRKYDSNWEMRMEEKDGFVGLWWKGQPVSFSSLWKLGVKTKDT
jgi:hypothetical protein